MRNWKPVAALLASALVTACVDAGPLTSEFGAHYAIVDSPAPAVRNDTLVVTVQYGGCSGNHAFDVRSRVLAAGTELWLFKETPDQPCDMLVIEERRFALSGNPKLAIPLWIKDSTNQFPLRP